MYCNCTSLSVCFIEYFWMLLFVVAICLFVCFKRRQKDFSSVDPSVDLVTTQDESGSHTNIARHCLVTAQYKHEAA